MADVYKATQLSLGRTVAIKVLRPGLADEPSFGDYVERFQIEARASARLNHPNIVQVYEVGHRDGLHYISQEFIDGLNLRQVIDRDGPLPVQLAIDVLHAVVTALDQAAAAGITHRDIKPENIMLSRRGEVKVADFGLARVAQKDQAANLTQVGLTVGTPLYMSPEQVQGGKVDPRSDLYSLGVTMFHVLTGRPPFDGESSLAIAVKQLHERPPSLTQMRSDRTGKNDLPKWYVDIIYRMLAKRPEDRYQSATAVVNEIHRYTGSIPTSPGSLYDSSPVNRLQAIMRREARLRSRWPIVAALLFASATCGVGLASLFKSPSLDWGSQTSSVGVEKFATVEDQFVEALRQDTAEAWIAVWQYHQAETNDAARRTDKNYEYKARLQLARLYYSNRNFQKIPGAIDRLAETPSASKLYRVIAHGWLFEAYDQTNPALTTRHLEAAKKLANDLTPGDIRVLDRTGLPTHVINRILTKQPT